MIPRRRRYKDIGRRFEIAFSNVVEWFANPLWLINHARNSPWKKQT